MHSFHLSGLAIILNLRLKTLSILLIYCVLQLQKRLFAVSDQFPCVVQINTDTVFITEVAGWPVWHHDVGTK